jgi:hypothetical protein
MKGVAFIPAAAHPIETVSAPGYGIGCRGLFDQVALTGRRKSANLYNGAAHDDHATDM